MDIEIASANFSQAARILHLEMPLGSDAFLPERMNFGFIFNGLQGSRSALRVRAGRAAACSANGEPERAYDIFVSQFSPSHTLRP